MLYLILKDESISQLVDSGFQVEVKQEQEQEELLVMVLQLEPVKPRYLHFGAR
jgi:hypothetical protein